MLLHSKMVFRSTGKMMTIKRCENDRNKGTFVNLCLHLKAGSSSLERSNIDWNGHQEVSCQVAIKFVSLPNLSPVYRAVSGNFTPSQKRHTVTTFNRPSHRRILLYFFALLSISTVPSVTPPLCSMPRSFVTKQMSTFFMDSGSKNGHFW